MEELLSGRGGILYLGSESSKGGMTEVRCKDGEELAKRNERQAVRSGKPHFFPRERCGGGGGDFPGSEDGTERSLQGDL